uniref:Uncharacterized protein n=1 Tax=Timema bartmani TaxID=61472 RepID=A0A7R9FD93_9NEOP|nr:unnamed protein product [Timema bartmani]
MSGCWLTFYLLILGFVYNQILFCRLLPAGNRPRLEYSTKPSISV